MDERAKSAYSSRVTETSTLDLTFAERPSSPAVRAPRTWRGFTVEHVTLDSDEGYALASAGERHYLALHDLVLADGELEISGLPLMHPRDLRGTVTFVPSGCTIRGWAKPASRRNAFTTLYFDPRSIREDLEARYGERLPPPSAHVRDANIQATMQKLAVVATAPEVDDLYAESLCLTAALEVFGIAGKPSAGRLSERQVRRITDFIEASLARSIDLDALAAVAGLSRYHFSRAFKVTLGIGPHAFVRRRRIAKAADLLLTTALTPDEIAALCGFPNPSTFRRVFQAETHATPLQFRRHAR